jgi:hypothetical protein
VQQAVEAYLALHTAVDSRRIGANYFCCKAPRNKIDLKNPGFVGQGESFLKNLSYPANGIIRQAMRIAFLNIWVFCAQLFDAIRNVPIQYLVGTVWFFAID